MLDHVDNGRFGGGVMVVWCFGGVMFWRCGVLAVLCFALISCESDFNIDININNININ